MSRWSDDVFRCSSMKTWSRV